jgi:hypothetical protein
MRNVTLAACAAVVLTLASGAYAQSPKSTACSHKELAEEGGGNGGVAAKLAEGGGGNGGTGAKLAEEGGGNGGTTSKLAEAGGGNGGAATQAAMAAPCP